MLYHDKKETRTTSVEYLRNDLNFFVPGKIITCQLSYPRSDFKKWKREMIKAVSTISAFYLFITLLNFIYDQI